jgi:hypothetical protein
MTATTPVIGSTVPTSTRLRVPPGTASALDRARDPRDPMNGPRYHTGRFCQESGCLEPAGTAWGPHWCQRHNAEALDRMSRSLADLGARVR